MRSRARTKNYCSKMNGPMRTAKAPPFPRTGRRLWVHAQGAPTEARGLLRQASVSRRPGERAFPSIRRWTGAQRPSPQSMTRAVQSASTRTTGTEPSLPCSAPRPGASANGRPSGRWTGGRHGQLWGGATGTTSRTSRPRAPRPCFPPREAESNTHPLRVWQRNTQGTQFSTGNVTTDLSERTRRKRRATRKPSGSLQERACQGAGL